MRLRDPETRRKMVTEEVNFSQPLVGFLASSFHKLCQAPIGRRSLRRKIIIGPSATSDGDADGVPDYCDNCLTIGNPGQENSDTDGAGDACDSCPLDFENDFDGDGLCSDSDPCPGDPNNDADGDGICEIFDNCPNIANAGQTDTDVNGIGDACQVNPTCSDSVDNDRDGLEDFGSDPGCASAADTTETDASLPCDDGIDNDGDVKIDTRSVGVGDPGCLDATSSREDPECDDGIDNDGDGPERLESLWHTRGQLPFNGRSSEYPSFTPYPLRPPSKRSPAPALRRRTWPRTPTAASVDARPARPAGAPQGSPRPRDGAPYSNAEQKRHLGRPIP